MKAPALILTAMISLCAGTAMAACPGKSASNGPDTTAGISKDGTHAPLESPNSLSQDRKNSAQKTARQCHWRPRRAVATRTWPRLSRDIEAQQQGEKTAAAQAKDNFKD
jgi:hypothetical protein